MSLPEHSISPPPAQSLSVTDLEHLNVYFSVTQYGALFGHSLDDATRGYIHTLRKACLAYTHQHQIPLGMTGDIHHTKVNAFALAVLRHVFTLDEHALYLLAGSTNRAQKD